MLLTNTNYIDSTTRDTNPQSSITTVKKKLRKRKKKFNESITKEGTCDRLQQSLLVGSQNARKDV